MKNRPAKRAAELLGLTAAILALATPLLSKPQRPSETDPARVRFEDTNRREIQLRGMSGANKKPLDPKERDAIVAQVKQDFERILTLHNDLVRAIGADKALDIDLVSNATAEIRKRATRLQSALALTQPDDNQQTQQKLKKPDDAQLKDALISLCKQIENFVANPVIKTPGTVDVEQLAKARRDLEGVIELGGSINKSAEKLKKSAR